MFLIIIVITAIVAVIYNLLKLNQSKINYPPGWYDVKGFNKLTISVTQAATQAYAEKYM